MTAARGFRIGLGFQLILAAGLLLVASGVVLSLSFYNQGTALAKAELEGRGKDLAAALARELRLAALTEDVATLKERADEGRETKDAVYVAIVIDGRELASAGEGSELALLREAQYAGAPSGKRYEIATGEEFFDFAAPIELRGRTATSGASASTAAEEDLLEMESDTPSSSASPAPGAGGSEKRRLGEVHLGISGRSYQRGLRAILVRSLVSLVTTSVIGLVLLYFLVGRLLAPLRTMAEVAVSIAKGDLTRSVASSAADDEVGQLGYALSRMTENLRATIDKVAGAAGNLDASAARIQGDSQSIGKGSDEQLGRTEETSASILEMDGSIREVAASADSMSRAVVETIASVEETTQSIRRINENVTALLAASEDASASILEMNANINEVSESADELSALVSESAASIESILESVGAVEANMRVLAAASKETQESIGLSSSQTRVVEAVATRTRDTMEGMTRDATAGQEAVQHTARGMERIQAVFDRTSRSIQALGARSEQIGQIVILIGGIAERTNLLALNAAIIAAKAGARGKGFAVVADEIRELSSRTAGATRDISRLVSAVRSDVGEAVKSSVEGIDAVVLGVELSRRAGDALAQISAGAEGARTLTQEIATGTVKQLELGENIARAMQRTEALVLEIFSAIETQSMESRGIRAAVDNMMDKATQVKKATVEQRTGGEQITRAVERVSTMIDEISRATSEQSKNSGLIIEAATSIRKLTEEVRRATSEQAEGSRQVVNAVEHIHTVTRMNAKRAAELRDSVASLLRQSQDLRSQIALFRR